MSRAELPGSEHRLEEFQTVGQGNGDEVVFPDAEVGIGPREPAGAPLQMLPADLLALMIDGDPLWLDIGPVGEDLRERQDGHGCLLRGRPSATAGSWCWAGP